jgi:hypothetical protein
MLLKGLALLAKLNGYHPSNFTIKTHCEKSSSKQNTINNNFDHKLMQNLEKPPK